MSKRDKYKATRKWPYHVSCGGVVYRVAGESRQYALLVRHGSTRGGPDTWHLPKGTLHRDETLEQCALREIREESGCEAAVEAYLGALGSRFTHPVSGKDIDKTVHYFLCRWLSDVADPDAEHDAVEWHAAESASALLDTEPKRESEILARAQALLLLPHR